MRNIKKILFIPVLIAFSFIAATTTATTALAKQEVKKSIDKDALETALSKYNTTKVKFTFSETELINYAYKNLVKNHEGMIVAFSGTLNGIEYQNLSSTDLSYIINKVVEIDSEESLQDGISFWGNIDMIQKGILKFEDFTLLCISIEYKNSKEDMDALDLFYERCIEEIYKEVSINSLSEFERCRMVHDFICENFDYDLTQSNFDDYSGVYNLINGKNQMVCQGYCLMAYKLLSLSDVQSIIVMSEDESHSWNLVKIENKWYQMDVTHDDTGYFNQRYDYKYFLKSSLKGKENYKIKESCLLYQNLDYINVAETDYKSNLSNPYGINPYLYEFYYRFLYEHNQAGYGIVVLIGLFLIFGVIIQIGRYFKRQKFKKNKIYDDYNSV